MTRFFWLIAAGCLLSGVFAGCGRGEYPSKTITIICPWAPGGGTDSVSRFWADALKKELGTPVVVVNKTGGAGAVGHSSAAHARPDGYTIGMITFELCTMHRMGITDLTYQDFRCIMQINADPAAIIVRKDAPWNTLREFLDDVKQNPGTFKMSGTSTGGAWDLARAGLLQADEQPANALVWVPTEGAAPSLVQLLGGHIDAVCCSVPEAAPSIEELKILSVMSQERLPEFPDIPTAIESGIQWVAVGWRGLAVPKETPEAIVDLLHKTCQRIGQSEEYRQFMKKAGFEIKLRSKDEFTRFLEAQDNQWKQVVEAAGYSKKK